MRLHIDKLIFGGLGLSRTKEGVVFVEQVIPGETVETKIIGKKSHTPIASPIKIIEKSTFRRSPLCKYYGVCGGCDFQFLKYERQLELKKEIFVECLHRIGKIEDITEIEVFGSPEWEYRIRAQLKVDHNNGAIGFFRKKSNEVVALEKCPLLIPGINMIFRKKKEVLAKVRQNIGQIKVIAGNSSISSSPAISGITENQTELEVAGSKFSLNGASFFQGNRFLLERMGTWLKPYIKGDFFVDMFGGIGFFSIMLGDRFSRGQLVENVPKQVKEAKNNLAANCLSHIDTTVISAEEYLSCGRLPKTDLLIVDPPRPGLTRKVREGIRNIDPETIVYFSCNPSTQARDVGFFINKCSYSIVKAALFDMYPQTHHIETGLLLIRK